VYAVVEYGTDHAVNFTDICTVFVAGLVIPLALGALLRLRMLPYGGGMVLIPLVAAFCSDSAALFAGMACGKHKLAPHVSPKKTVEGAIGGLVGGMAGMVIFRIIFTLCTTQQLHIGWCVLLGLVGAAMGQLGDLSFSLVKRQQGIKDYGRLLPGHGGVLDRFDSVIFAAPVVWLILSHVTL
jgi:phosphatidate cytidylyltransferase